jgi:hypothetical protein
VQSHPVLAVEVSCLATILATLPRAARPDPVGKIISIALLSIFLAIVTVIFLRWHTAQHLGT